MRAFELASIDVKAMVDSLSKLKVGERASWDSLTKLIGRDIRYAGHSILAQARHKLMRDQQMVFGVERGQGLVRLDDVQIVDTGQHFVGKIRRTAKRALRQITTVDYDKLPNESKIRHNAAASMFGAIHHVSSQKSIGKLESKVKELSGTLPLAKTLEAFKD